MPYKNLADKTERQRQRRAQDWRMGLARYDIEFVGCDGEGFYPPLTMHERTDLFFTSSRRQQYGLMRIGRSLLCHGNPLSSDECLAFISEQPKRKGLIYVAYYFDYDATMILRDLPTYLQLRILRGEYTHYKHWIIRYHPKQFFEVGRADVHGKTIPGSIITINEVGAFFQCKFVKALEQWEIGSTVQRARIQQGKDRRGTETEIDDETIEYNALECECLEKLMHKFASVVIDIDLKPMKWRGPGWIAARALQLHKVPKRISVEPLIPDTMRAFAPAAYYGGRFEVTKIGEIGAAYAYDLNSAYPAAMLTLPCVKHAHIREYKAGDAITDHSLVYIVFDHPKQPLCGIPIRTKSGLIFPRRGRGWYWGIEINAAIRAGMTVTVHGGWHVERVCDCKPFTFVRGLYDERKRVGKDAKGIALKLTYNSLYGKLVQHVGTRPYYNPIWAGLITATVRAQLIDAYTHNMESVTMLATDAVYSTEPLKHLPLSKELGDWSAEMTDDLFIVQPGIYEAVGRSVKTRGVNDALMRNAMPVFREAWRDYMKFPRSIPPSAQVECHNFISLKLAAARGHLASTGIWQAGPRQISFDWTSKRALDTRMRDGYIETQPKLGHSTLESLVYDPHMYNVQKELDIMRFSQPDHLELL